MVTQKAGSSLRRLLAGIVIPGSQILLAGSVFACDVFINPDDNIQQIVFENAPGTTFCFQPGVYRLTEGIVPRENDTFTSETPRSAILNGSQPLTFEAQPPYWVAWGQVVPNPVHTGACYPSYYEGCKYAEAVFYDDQPLWRVMSLEEVGPGTFYIDYDTNSVYLADDPNGHNVEVAVSPQAFAGWMVENVRVRGFVIEKFADDANTCALQATTSWIIRGNEVRFNHGAGICNGAEVVGNYVHHNGESGLFADSGTGILVENNEIAFNNIAGFDWDGYYGGGGGTKWSKTTNLTVRGNQVHDNFGPGLWTDTDNAGTLYENNHTWRNLGAGIAHEISFDAIIRNNLVEEDGFVPPDQGGTNLWWGAGIFVESSSNVEIYGNTVAYSMNGIGATNIGRGYSDDGRAYVVENLDVHDNTIIQASGTATGIVSDGDPEIYTSWHNWFYDNTYFLQDLSARCFQWMEWDRTPDEWQNYGNDVNGTFQLIE